MYSHVITCISSVYHLYIIVYHLYIICISLYIYEILCTCYFSETWQTSPGCCANMYFFLTAWRKGWEKKLMSWENHRNMVFQWDFIRFYGICTLVMTNIAMENCHLQCYSGFSQRVIGVEHRKTSQMRFPWCWNIDLHNWVIIWGQCRYIL